MKLEDLRKKIDLVDEKLLLFLAKRGKLVKKVRLTKQKLGLQLNDIDREMEILERIRKKALVIDLKVDFVTKIFKEIFRESKRLQRQK